MIRKLIIGNGRAEREILLVGNVTIGRDASCHVSEPDPLLSRRHAEIVANAHGVSVRDLNSRNGILVNGEKTREHTLLPGDVVQMGHLQLRYVEEQVVRPAESRDADPRRQAPPPAPPELPATQPYDLDRFRPEPTPPPQAAQTPAKPARWRPEPTPLPGRWKPEPTPLPGRRVTGPPPPPPPPPPRPQNFTPVPRGRAAFDAPRGQRHSGPDESLDTTRLAPRHDTTLGPGAGDPDQTRLAVTREASGVDRWVEPPDPDATMLARPVAPPPQAETTRTPGNATFAAALQHLAGIASPGSEPLSPAGTGERLVANAELRVTDASPGCADLLGVPDEPLVGDSLTDVFLRAVRRAYAEPDGSLSFSIARGPRGSITVTLTLDKTGGTD